MSLRFNTGGNKTAVLGQILQQTTIQQKLEVRLPLASARDHVP